MSEISSEKRRTENQFSLFRVLVGVFVGLVVLFYLFTLFAPPHIPRERAYRIVCAVNLEALGVAMQTYASNFGNKYPTADKWCDLLLQHTEISEKQFICRGAFKKGDQERCHYAMNSNCEPNSPPDMVLLFETKGGWNQVGEPELMTFENHTPKGCNVLFNDGHIEFVKPEQIGQLKWKVDEGNAESADTKENL